MPEGDTIRRLADSLTRKFEGQSVKSSLFRHPRLATVDLSGTEFVGADACGKHLLMRFSNKYTIHVHLRMNGSIHSRFAREFRPDRRKFEIEFESGWATAVDIPILEMFRTADEAKAIGYLGPDICGYYNHDVAIERLLGAGATPISQAMLDQRILAGFGNIYAVETPFIVGINPFTPVNNLSSAAGLLSIGVGLIRSNARFGPQNTTGKDIGRTRHWVLSSRTTRCRLCGSTLTRRAGRDTPWRRRTAWCPQCQPADAIHVDLNRAAKLLALHPCREIVNLAEGELIADVGQPVKTKFTPNNQRRVDR